MNMYLDRMGFNSYYVRKHGYLRVLIKRAVVNFLKIYNFNLYKLIYVEDN